MRVEGFGAKPAVAFLDASLSLYYPCRDETRKDVSDSPETQKIKAQLVDMSRSLLNVRFTAVACCQWIWFFVVSCFKIGTC